MLDHRVDLEEQTCKTWKEMDKWFWNYSPTGEWHNPKSAKITKKCKQ